MPVPLAILDLAPLIAGGDVTAALRNTVDLAQQAERFGYARYWVAEHHLTPGVASSQPAVLLGQLAAHTDRIRLGSGAVQTGYLTPLAVVEQFGLLDALYPGRFDLGLGRSGQSRKEALTSSRPASPPTAASASPAPPSASPSSPPSAPERFIDGLLIPKPFSFTKLLASKRSELFSTLLQHPGAEPHGLAEVLDQIQALLTTGISDDEGNEAHAVPGEGADLEIWILGSSGGESAQEAGARGLPFAANYHVAPASVLEAVSSYRDAFRPSEVLTEPHVMVSADVVVADDDATARELAKPYGLWVRSIRTGAGAMPFPSPAQVAEYDWTDADRDLVDDRIRTQFVGSPATVAKRLETLQRVTGADELLVTTITHDHADRVRSFELLAKEWISS